MTVATDAVVDAEGALAAWINSLTSTLVGAGKPLELGAWVGDGPRGTDRPRGPYKGAYAVLTVVGGPVEAPGGIPFSYPRVSASIYGVTKLQASTAAVAYTNTLRTLAGQPVTVTWTPPDNVQRTAVLQSVEQITGPLLVRGGSEPQYLVDAIVAVSPA